MIARAVSAQLLSNAMAGGASFLFTMWVAGVVGPDRFAQYSFYFSVGSIVAILMAGGYHNLLLRHQGPQAFETEPNNSAGLAGAASGHALIILIVALGVSSALFGDKLAGLSASYLYFFFLIVGQFISAVLRGRSAFLTESAWSISQRLIAITIPSLYYYFFGHNTNPAGILALSAIGMGLPAFFCYRRLGIADLARPIWQIRFGLLALPFLLIDFGTMLNWRTDVFVLTTLKTDLTETGRYLVAARIYEAIVYLAAGPLFVVTVHFRKRGDQDRRVFLRTLAVSVTAAVLVASASRVVAPGVLEVFAGARYSASAHYLSVLLWGLLFQYPAALMLAIAIAGRHPWRYATVIAASALFNLILCSVLTRSYGVVGAAYSNVLTQFLLAVAFSVSLIREANANAAAAPAT